MFGYTVGLKQFASYDDSGVTGHKNYIVFEGGEYKIFVGENVCDNVEAYSFALDEIAVKPCGEACAPKIPFKRMINAGGLKYENAPTATVDLRERILSRLPRRV